MDDTTTIQTQPRLAREKLQLVEDLLKFHKGNYILGGEASHADALVFGWYAFSSLNPILIKEVWEGLPLVKSWAERIKGLVGEEELPK